MSVEQPENRYSIIKEKNPREILLLRGRGCGWRKCTFCDYHLDFSVDEAANFLLNQRELSKVTGIYGRLETINSGSFPELDEKTIARIREVCGERHIGQLHAEFHWMYRDKIEAFREYFAKENIDLKVKLGVESFDYDYRESILKKGIDTDVPEEIAKYADEVCLLFGLAGQTLESMQRDIDIGLRFFERVCINIMVENSTAVKPDPAVIDVFCSQLYEKYKDDDRIDILLENTGFGVGDKYEKPENMES